MREPLLRLEVERVVLRMTRRVHDLHAAQIGKRPREVGVRQRARLGVVVGLEAAQVHARRSEVGDFARDRPGQLSLESERPLTDVGRRHVVLGSEDERRRSRAREGLLEAEIRPEGLGRFVAADCERRVAHGVEYRISDVAHVVDAAAGSNNRPGSHRPGQAEPRGEIVVVGLVGAPAETAITHIWNAPETERRVALIGIAGARPHEDRCAAVVPDVVDIDDLVVDVGERLVVFPPQAEVDREVRRHLPVVLDVEGVVVRPEVRDGGADLRLRVVHGSQQEVRERAPPRCAAGSSGCRVYRPSKLNRPRVTTPPI